MRRAMLAGVTMMGLCGFSLSASADGGVSSDDASARAFKPRFDTFASGHFSNPHFAGPPPLMSRDCEDPERNRAYTCFYTFGTVVDVAAETEPGSDRLAKVTLTWDGSDHRRDLFAQTAGFVVGALSGETTDGTWRDVTRSIYADLPMLPFTFAPRDWRSGHWAYRFWHDGRYGARNTVLFTATRTDVP